MNPINNLSHLMGHDLESSEDEDSYSSVDSTSGGVLVVPLTSMEFPIFMMHSPSPVSSARVIDSTSPIQSTASMPPVHPMPPAHPTQPVHPMPPAHPTQPVHPMPPAHPTQPVHPMPPAHPTQPVHPMPPAHPTQPVHPMPPAHPTQPVHPMPPAHPTQPVHPMSPVHTVPPAHPMSPVPSTSRGIQENYDGYRSEATRRSSFRNWPISFIDPVSLAAAGFYYTGETDIVKCFECQLVVNLWTEGDIPMQIHEMRSRQCKFIRNEHCDNVPSGADSDNVLRTKRRNRNTSCQKYISEYVNNVTGQELYETSAEAPIEITEENPEGSNEMTLVEKIAALEKENRALKDARSCKVCTEREATITFLPCGHLATCQYCSPAFTKCIICRKNIKAINRTFLV